MKRKKLSIAIGVLCLLVASVTIYLIKRSVLIQGKYFVTNSCIYQSMNFENDSVSFIVMRERSEIFFLDSYYRAEMKRYPVSRIGNQYYIIVVKDTLIHQINVDKISNYNIHIDYKQLSVALFDTIYSTSIDQLNLVKAESNMIRPYRFFEEGKKCELTEELIKRKIEERGEPHLWW